MMTKMTAREARDNFTDLLGAVYYGKKPIAVEKKGRIFAVVVNPSEYEVLEKAARARFFDLTDEIQKENKGKKISEVMKDVSGGVESVRNKNYAKSG